jgi:hypothetical protein
VTLTVPVTLWAAAGVATMADADTRSAKAIFFMIKFPFPCDLVNRLLPSTPTLWNLPSGEIASYHR